MRDPETLIEAIRFFSDPEVCHNYMVELRWGNKVECPHCGSDKVGKFSKTRRTSNCKECKKQFSVKVGTIFEDSPLGLDKWLTAFWMIVSFKNGVSSCEMARSLGITQKSSWFMMHRIRLAIRSGNILKQKMGGVVEVDESYIGGLAKNMHKGTKVRRGINGTGMAGKTAIVGLLQRHGPNDTSRIVAEVLPSRPTKGALIGRIKKYVLENTQVHTDALNSYNDLKDNFDHRFIDHAEKYVEGHVHTNGLENFWSLLKRGLKGTYICVSPPHLFRYLDEQVFRFNERKMTDLARFNLALSQVAGKKLPYKELIAG